MIPYHNINTGMDMKNHNKLYLIGLGMLLVILFTGCTSSAGAASSWPGVSLDSGTGFFAYSSQVFAINMKNGSLQWQYPAQGDSKVQYYAAPAIGTDTIYAGSYANTLSAINKSNGIEKWTFTLAQDRYIGSPLVVGSTVYAPNSDKYLYALNDAGDLIWKFKTAGPNWTQPVTDGTNLYLASMDHHLYALKLEYAANDLALDKNGSRTLVSNPLWSVDLDTAIAADPVFSNGSIYTATINGNLYSVDAATGKLNWSFIDGGGYRAVWGTLVVTDQAVFFGDEDGNVFAVSTETGKALWPSPYPAGAAVIAGGVLTDKGPLFVNEQGRVFIIDVNQEPQPVTSLDTSVFSPPAYGENLVVLAPATKEKLFTAINLDGNEVWSFIPSK